MGKSNFKISVRRDYILVERPKDYEVVLDEMPAMLAELSAACKEAGCRKVLILGPKTHARLETMEIHDLGNLIATTRLQIAIVELHDAPDDDVAFLETVVFNRGGPLQFFRDETEAKNWLADS